ncbi:hypothetical protein BJ165DRAFT_1409601 [Panaeolus papilionaceus]|nr:hypothetical protein BJ165DRAFT_1409601 [Panaeolus papilionaceus]
MSVDERKSIVDVGNHSTPHLIEGQPTSPSSFGDFHTILAFHQYLGPLPYLQHYGGVATGEEYGPYMGLTLATPDFIHAQFTFQPPQHVPFSDVANRPTVDGNHRPQKRARVERSDTEDSNTPKAEYVPAKKRQHQRDTKNREQALVVAANWPWIKPDEGVAVRCMLADCKIPEHDFKTMDEMENHLWTPNLQVYEKPGHGINKTHARKLEEERVKCSWEGCSESILPSGMLRHIQCKHVIALADKCGKCEQLVLPRNKNFSGHFKKCAPKGRAQSSQKSKE